MKTSEALRYAVMKPSDLGALASILSSSFSFPPDDAEPWLGAAGFDNVRVVTEGPRPVGCSVQIPMGQFWGGKSVPMVGIAGVAVGMADRGRNVARMMMEHTVREIAAQKVALSALYPSTQRLYRSVGYERAGKLMVVTIPTEQFTAPRTELRSRSLGPGDERSTIALYEEVAPAFHGYLDRGQYMWARVRATRQKQAFGVGFFAPPPAKSRLREGALEAYVYFAHVASESQSLLHTIYVKDAIARSPEGYGAIARFLGEQRSLARSTQLRAGPSTPLLMMLSEQHYQEEKVEDWMVRVTHVESALLSRGYPPIDADLVFDVRDPLVSDNTGRFALRLRAGQPTVGKTKKAVGNRTIALDVRALAPLYTGYLSATQLGRLGFLAGSPEALALADALFASAMPSMCEMF